jgi:hypothetical protein
MEFDRVYINRRVELAKISMFSDITALPTTSTRLKATFEKTQDIDQSASYVKSVTIESYSLFRAHFPS